MGCTSCGGNSSPIRQKTRQGRVNQRGSSYGRKKAVVYNERVHGGHEALKPVVRPATAIEEPIVEEEVTPPQEESIHQEKEPLQKEEVNL